jgi:hypothetical protein
MSTPPQQLIASIEWVITGTSLIPDHITALLDVTPTRSFTKGDRNAHRYATKRPWGLWALKFQGPDVEHNAVQLLTALNGKESVIRTLIDTPGMQVSIAIWWEPIGGQGGFSLNSATLARLCALGTRIDVYFPGYQQ